METPNKSNVLGVIPFEANRKERGKHAMNSFAEFWYHSNEVIFLFKNIYAV